MSQQQQGFHDYPTLPNSTAMMSAAAINLLFKIASPPPNNRSSSFGGWALQSIPGYTLP
jgi:hypothetical protein